MGQMQQVAQVLFVLVAIEPAHGAASVRGDVGLVRGMQRLGQWLQDGHALNRRKFDAFGRHFMLLDAIVNADPLFAGGALGKVHGQGSEVEAARSGFPVMTAAASLFDELGRHDSECTRRQERKEHDEDLHWTHR